MFQITVLGISSLIANASASTKKAVWTLVDVIESVVQVIKRSLHNANKRKLTANFGSFGPSESQWKMTIRYLLQREGSSKLKYYWLGHLLMYSVDRYGKRTNFISAESKLKATYGFLAHYDCLAEKRKGNGLLKNTFQCWYFLIGSLMNVIQPVVRLKINFEFYESLLIEQLLVFAIHQIWDARNDSNFWIRFLIIKECDLGP